MTILFSDCTVPQTTPARFSLWRLLPSGTMDSGFGANGIAQATFPEHSGQFGGYRDLIGGIAIQPNGRIVAGGSVSANPSRFGFARFIGTTAAPTAAGVSVSGRVMTPDGRGLRNAQVVLTDPHGVVRTAVTGALGYYSFNSVETGQTYIVSAVSRSYTYAPRVINLSDAVDDMDFLPG